MIKAGDLNKLVSLERKVSRPDGRGGQTVTWEVFAKNIWAAIWPVKASERMLAMKESEMITHKIRIRYRRRLTAGFRVKYQGTCFNINGMINVRMGNSVIEMYATEVI